MGKFLIGLVYLATSCVPAYAADRVVEGTSFPGMSYQKNFVKNPEFERNDNSVTDASSIASRSATTPLQGLGSLLIDAANSAEVVKFDTNTMDLFAKGQNCEVKFVYNGNALLYKAYVEQGSTKVTTDLQLSNPTYSQNVSINFPCGDLSSNSHLVIESTSASAAAIRVDQVYLGLATNVGSGTIVTDWASYTPTFVGFGTAANIYIKYRRVGDTLEIQGQFDSGTATATAASFSLPSGLVSDYAPNNGFQSVGSWVSNDGTATHAKAGPLQVTNGASVVNFTFWDYTPAVSPQTYQNGNAVVSSANQVQVYATIKIVGWTSGTLVAVNPDPTITEWASYSLAITAVTTNPTLGTIVTNNAQWRRVGGDLELTWSFYQGNPIGSGTNGSGQYLFSLPPGLVIDNTIVKVSVDANQGTSVGKASGYSAGTLTLSGYPYAYDTTHLSIVLGNSATASTPVGSTFLGLGSTEITYTFTAKVPIVGWKAPNAPVPLLVGSVSSNSSGLERMERATITCGSSSTIDSQSGSWISSIGNISGNRCSLTFKTGIFSQAPNCWGTYSTPSTTYLYSINVQITTATAGSIGGVYHNGATTGVFGGPDTMQIICMGQR